METYLIAKSLHIIAVISWMAGLLYLPRLYVYHATAPKGGELSETLKVMERKLLRYIMNPAMIASWGLGIWLLVMTEAYKSGWFHGKFLLIFILSGLHGMMSAQRKRFERDENTKSAKFYRWFNEAPTILMVLIVILAVMKPF